MQSIHCPNCHTIVGKFVSKGNEEIPLIGNTTITQNKEIVWLKDPSYRPFCSQRCKTMDLGAWADGSYSIPTALKPEDYDAMEGESPE